MFQLVLYVFLFIPSDLGRMFQLVLYVFLFIPSDLGRMFQLVLYVFLFIPSDLGRMFQLALYVFLFIPSDLGRMFQLVSRIQDGLGELKNLLESHITNQGLAAIDTSGDAALNVSGDLEYCFLSAVWKPKMEKLSNPLKMGMLEFYFI